jgi:hypothetical protein
VLNGQVDRLAVVVRELVGVGMTLQEVGDSITSAIGRVKGGPSYEPRRPTAVAQPVQKAPLASSERPLERRPVITASEGEVHLKAGARRILEALARHHPMVFTRAQVGTLTGFKISGGTFQTYWSQLRRLGYLDEQGGDIRITEEGLAAAGVEPAAPATTEELLAMWGDRLKAGARQMLDVLVANYPRALSYDELGQAVGMVPSGGTFQTYVSTLRRNGLADTDRGQIKASDSLFVGDTR